MGINEEYQDVEIRVGEETKGFTLQLWTKTPDFVSVGFASPTGEIYEKVPARLNESKEISFLLENSRIYVDYWILQQDVGDELIEIRFHTPAPGIWTIRVYNESVIEGEYNMWLPVTGMIPDDTYFLRPDPDITITEPGNSSMVITTAGYNHISGGIYINSGRGYTRNDRKKPDICAPAVDVYGPVPAYTGYRSGYTVKSGTSAAAALTAGAAALIQEWAFVKENDIRMNGNVLRKYLILGARRENGISYPNRQWGYGELDIYNTFNMLRNL